MENQSPRPIVTILVGASGAGKSAWLSDNRDKVDGPYIDVDAIKNSLGDPEEDLHWELAEAARKRMIEVLVQKKHSFTYETTYAYPEGVRRFKDILAENFAGKATFFDTGNVETNIRRVHDRTVAGGHPVKEEDIRFHYEKSTENILQNIEDFQKITFIDTESRRIQTAAVWTPESGLVHYPTRRKIQWIEKFSSLNKYPDKKVWMDSTAPTAR